MLCARLDRMDRQVVYRNATQLVRFGAVGVLSTLIYFALFGVVSLIDGLPTWLRGALAYGPSIIANYALQRTFTFRSQRSHTKAGPRHLAVQLGGMAINSGLLWLLVDWWRLAYWPSQFGAFVVMTAWSYLGQRYWAFHDADD